MPRQTGIANEHSLQAGVKKPYTAPTLKRLGSVRDLTLGSVTTGAADAKVTGGNKGS
jgi:hypothetical protein